MQGVAGCDGDDKIETRTGSYYHSHSCYFKNYAYWKNKLRIRKRIRMEGAGKTLFDDSSSQPMYLGEMEDGFVAYYHKDYQTAKTKRMMVAAELKVVSILTREEEEWFLSQSYDNDGSFTRRIN